MSTPHGTPSTLSYSTLPPRRRSALAVAASLAALVIAPAGLLLAALALHRNLIPHKMLCPSCGGWVATVAVVATVSLLIACIAILVNTIRRRATFGSILLAVLAVVSAAGQALIAIAFYFAIQM